MSNHSIWCYCPTCSQERRLEEALDLEDKLRLQQRELLSQYRFVVKDKSQDNTKEDEMSSTRKGTYQYIVWYRDPKDSEKDEKITDVQSVVATGEEHVKRIAIRGLETKWDEKLDNIVVEVRPF
jgi:hypothetical protein